MNLKALYKFRDEIDKSCRDETGLFLFYKAHHYITNNCQSLPDHQKMGLYHHQLFRPKFSLEQKRRRAQEEEDY